MYINSISSNFVQKSSYLNNSSKINFNGEKKEISTETLLEKINNMSDVAPENRADILNDVAIKVFNNPKFSSPELVEAAILQMPAEDEKFSASRYATELLRLTKYTASNKALKNKVKEVIVAAETKRKMDTTQQGFDPTICNKLGQEINYDKSQYYGDKFRKISRNTITKYDNY